MKTENLTKNQNHGLSVAVKIMLGQQIFYTWSMLYVIKRLRQLTLKITKFKLVS